MTLVPNETEQALNRQHDVYAAAREEYRKKIAEQAAEIERLRAALREVMDDLTLIGKNNWLPVGLLDDVIYVNARAALEDASDE